MQDFADSIAATALSQTLAATAWVVPTLQTIHLLAIAILVSSVLMIDLRVLGFTGRSQTIAQTMHRFAPWFWASLVILALTGLGMIAAEPVRELMAFSFWAKMALLLVGIAVAVAMMRHVRGNAVLADGHEMSPARMRRVGWVTLLVWVAIIFLGRFIAYDPQIWGPLSPMY